MNGEKETLLAEKRDEVREFRRRVGPSTVEKLFVVSLFIVSLAICLAGVVGLIATRSQVYVSFATWGGLLVIFLGYRMAKPRPRYATLLMTPDSFSRSIERKYPEYEMWSGCFDKIKQVEFEAGDEHTRSFRATLIGSDFEIAHCNKSGFHRDAVTSISMEYADFLVHPELLWKLIEIAEQKSPSSFKQESIALARQVAEEVTALARPVVLSDSPPRVRA